MLALQLRISIETMRNFIPKMVLVFQPSAISMDYEMAAIRAAQSAFFTAQLFGCFFHLAKNMQKHLATLPNALAIYRTDANFALYGKTIIAVAFAPPNEIERVMLALERNIPLSLTFLVDWFKNNYVGK